MTYKFEGMEKDEGRITLVFGNATQEPMKVGAADFYLGKYDQGAISVREQQQAVAELINQSVYPHEVLNFDY